MLNLIQTKIMIFIIIIVKSINSIYLLQREETIKNIMFEIFMYNYIMGKFYNNIYSETKTKTNQKRPI